MAKVYTPKGTGQDQERVATGETAATLVAWGELERHYAPAVVATVRKIMLAGGMTLADILALEIADHSDLVVKRKRLAQKETGRYLQITRYMQSARRHMRALLEMMGTGAKINAPVPVPEWVQELVADVEPDYDVDITVN